MTSNAILLFNILALFTTCSGQNQKPGESKLEQSANRMVGDTGSVRATIEMDNRILCIFQDKQYNYWFGTQNSGVYRFDGNTLVRFTEQDGLSDNQVQSIQEDKLGNLWFGTGGFGVSRFDGRAFTNFTNKEGLEASRMVAQEWTIEPDDLWFCAGSGVYRYDGHAFTYLPFPKTDLDTKSVQGRSNLLTNYGVYSILKDKKGNLWFGTQSRGVCRYDGKSFTWLTEQGLKGPAVLGLFEDQSGNLWFGNNGYGLFRYDGSVLTNFTKEKGLSNDDFLKTSEVSNGSAPSNLARIYAMHEDNNGDLWIGTIDSGVWRYDGVNLTNFTTKDGLTSNAVTTIYKDKNGELLFGTDGGGVCLFDGTRFTKIF